MPDMLFRLCQSIEQVPWIVTVNSTAGIISLVWLVHYIGMFLLVGTMVLVDLRVLGLAGRKQGIAQLAGQLFPWTWTGLVMVIASGSIMFAGQATTFYPATVFRIKMVELLAAVGFGFIVQRKVPQWDRLTPIPVGAKSLAILSLVLWVGAILAGLEVPAFLPI
jgi:hypothetical protein